MRIGYGYDVHRLVTGRMLILGGVPVPSEKGLEGYSDADVLVHSIMDAILGAAALGDIGAHFPSSVPEYRDISSLKLLSVVYRRITKEGYYIENIDSTIVAQSPRLSPYIPQMKARLIKVLQLDPNRLNIKATTEEKLGFTGQGDGIAAHAVALLNTNR